MKTFQKPSEAISWTKECLKDYGFFVRTERWQAIPSPDDMWEVLNHSFQMVIPEKLEELTEEVKPNLPWADKHFNERISGIPLNPPPSHSIWPFAQKNNKEFGGNTKFSHTYPERIWPRFAESAPHEGNFGIRFRYGDFNDVLDLLEREPYTRQAFLPIWFPEDTGSSHKERVPCTIGYHFIRREDRLHIVYYIRSCDYLRHFRDDIYLACRKLYWVIDNMKKRSDSWNNVKPGYYTMHITSLHCFYKERGVLNQSNK